jgi:hypothetical protein
MPNAIAEQAMGGGEIGASRHVMEISQLSAADL